MPNQWDLTNENIENTYQRVLQTPDGVNIYDGTGSLFYLGVFNNTSTGSFGSFYDTTTQMNPIGSVPRSMSLNRTDISNGVLISGSTDPYNTYIKIVNAGVYNIQFSAQLDKTDSGTDEIVIWLRKNGSDLIDTATTISLVGNNAKNVAAWNWFVTSAANDYYQIIWYSPDTDIRLLAEVAGGGHPGIPSVIVTANRVDTFFSNTGSFSGSFIGTHTGSFTGSFTGSLLGTASWADSASQALTASFYQETDPIFVAKSASLATTGSNTFIGNQVVSGSFIIETASSAAALRITQTGDGNALLVEDSTNPDATPFVVTTSGSIGIGTTNPQYAIVASSSTATDTVMFFDGGTAANANLVAAADTSIKLPLLVLSDRTNAYGINTSYWIGLDRASTALYANRNDVLYVNNYLDKGHYFITNNGGSKATRMVISGSGEVGIGITSPLYKLHVRNGAVINSSTWGGSVGVFENSGSNAYLSVLASDTYAAGIGFGTAAHRVSANLYWNSTTKGFDLATNTASAFLTFGTDTGTERMRITSGGLIGIGTTTPDSILHVHNATAGSVTSISGTTITIENNSTNYLSMLAPDANHSGIVFGSPSDPFGAYMRWRQTDGFLDISTADSGDYLRFGAGNSDFKAYVTSTGFGVNKLPTSALDISGSAVVTGSLFLPSLTTTSQNNVVTVDITTGQLYYTASTAFGGGSSTPTFPYTGSAIISGSLTVTGSFFVSNSIDSDSRTLYDSAATSSVDWEGRVLKDGSGANSVDWTNRELRTPGGNRAFTWETDYAAGSQIYQSRTIGINPQEALSSTPLQYAGQSISASIDPSTNLGEIVYLKTDGIWYPVNQTNDTSTKMLGVYVDSNYVLLEGDVTLDDTNLIQSPGYGLPVYIRQGDNVFSTTQPPSGYIRIVGHCYYENVATPGYWIIKFKPSNDWYKI